MQDPRIGSIWTLPVYPRLYTLTMHAANTTPLLWCRNWFTTTRYEYIWYSKQFLWDTCTCWYSEPYSTTPMWHSCNNVDPMDLDTRRFHKQSVWIDTSHISWKRVYKSTTYTANLWQCCSIMCTSHSLQYCTQACMYSMMEYQTHLHSRWHKVHLLFEQVWFI